MTQGGAVVADACNRIQAQVADVTGVAVIDVVEGPCLLFSTCRPPAAHLFSSSSSSSNPRRNCPRRPAQHGRPHRRSPKVVRLAGRRHRVAVRLPLPLPLSRLFCRGRQLTPSRLLASTHRRNRLAASTRARSITSPRRASRSRRSYGPRTGTRRDPRAARAKRARTCGASRSRRRSLIGAVRPVFLSLPCFSARG